MFDVNASVRHIWQTHGVLGSLKVNRNCPGSLRCEGQRARIAMMNRTAMIGATTFRTVPTTIRREVGKTSDNAASAKKM